jgi:hypothetical protein
MATESLPQLKIQIGNFMNWLFRWLSRKIEVANRPPQPEQPIWGNSITSARGNVFANKLSDGMTFNIHRASGGMVVEHSYYDEKAVCNHQSIHIITDDQDLGEQLAKIITIEMLRR